MSIEGGGGGPTPNGKIHLKFPFSLFDSFPNCNYKCGTCYQSISSCVFSFDLMKIIYLILSNCTLHGARGSNPCYCHEEGENNNNNNKSREGKVIIILRSIEFYSSRNTTQRSCLTKLYTFAEPITVFVFNFSFEN